LPIDFGHGLLLSRKMFLQKTKDVKGRRAPSNRVFYTSHTITPEFKKKNFFFFKKIDFQAIPA
jgi:hypothetical protein